LFIGFKVIVAAGLLLLGGYLVFQERMNIGQFVAAEIIIILIIAEEITFGFPEQRNKIFDNLSFKINANEKVILSGKSGSGKSILLQILAGIHQIEDGELYVNGIPFNNYERDHLFNAFGVSLPVNQIFEGTFRENILMGRTIEEQKINEVLKILSLQEYLVHQPFIEENEKKSIIDYITDSRNNCTVLIVSDFYYWKEKCDRFLVLGK